MKEYIKRVRKNPMLDMALILILVGFVTGLTDNSGGSWLQNALVNCGFIGGIVIFIVLLTSIKKDD